MLKKIILVLSLLLLVNLILPSLFLRKSYLYWIDSTEKIITINPGVSYPLNLTLPSGKISYIELLVKNPSLENTEDFYLEISNQKTKLSSFNAGDPSWLRIPTSPTVKGPIFSLNIINPATNTKPVIIQADKNLNPSIKIVSKLSLSESFSNILNHKLAWLQATNKTAIFTYLFILILLCFF